MTRVALAAIYSLVISVSHNASAQRAGPPWHIAVIPQVMNKEEVERFRKAILEAGYVEGRDILIDWHIAPGDAGRLPQLAQELVQEKVDVIVVTTTFAAQAAKRATATIPIIMATVADPVSAGLVQNLAHPGGNITGFSLMETELHAKRLELLKEALPKLSRVAVLWNPSMPSHPRAVENLRAAAQSMSITLHLAAVQAPEELDAAFSNMVRARAEALYVLQDQLFTALRPRILSLAGKARLPVIHANKFVAQSGALMSYGPDVADLYRRAAGYVDRILKGAKPGDLPIEQPTKFELVVNLKTAKQLGLTISESLLQRADEVIR
jgi:putative ABC transport system substrate-binding protein